MSIRSVESVPAILAQSGPRARLTQCQSGKRRRIPRFLTPEQVRTLLANLSEPHSTMVLLSAGLGLRASHVMGLKRGDLDWKHLVVRESAALWLAE